MYFLDVNNDNIIPKTKDFIEKAKSKMEKPKDEPRYKAIVQYELQFKEKYAQGLSSIIVAALKQYKVKLTENATSTK